MSKSYSLELEFMGLYEFIKNIAGNRKVFYVPNGGNWGDGLIRYGAEKFFRSYNIGYTKLNPMRVHKMASKGYDFSEDILIYGGGGAWANSYSNGLNYVCNVEQLFNKVLVLPSTYQSDFSFSTENVHLYARDFMASYKKSDNKFCHDMAFYIGPLDCTSGSGDGFFFRTDKESSGLIELPDNNRDLSREGKTSSNVTGFFRAIAPFKTVHTDRLHVSIASALLGKNVNLYDNSYFKNKAVYEATMRDIFPKVKFQVL